MILKADRESKKYKKVHRAIFCICTIIIKQTIEIYCGKQIQKMKVKLQIKNWYLGRNANVYIGISQELIDLVVFIYKQIMKLN